MERTGIINMTPRIEEPMEVISDVEYDSQFPQG